MKQYCKYCTHVACKHDGRDIYRCLALGIELYPISKVSRANHCKHFDLDGFDVKTGRKYIPVEELGKHDLLDGQLTL